MNGNFSPPSPQHEQHGQPEPLPDVSRLHGLPTENLHRLIVRQQDNMLHDAAIPQALDDGGGKVAQRRHEAAAHEVEMLERVWKEIDTGPPHEPVEAMVGRLAGFVRRLRDENIPSSEFGRKIGRRRLPVNAFSKGGRERLANMTVGWMEDLASMDPDYLESIVGPFQAPQPPHAPSPPPSHRPHGTPLPPHPARGTAVVPPPSSPPSGGPPAHGMDSGATNRLPHYKNLEGVSGWDMYGYVEGQMEMVEERAQGLDPSDPNRASLDQEIKAYRLVAEGVEFFVGPDDPGAPDRIMDALAAFHRQLGGRHYDGDIGPLGDPAFRDRVRDVIDRVGHALSTMTFDQLLEDVAMAHAPRLESGSEPNPATGDPGNPDDSEPAGPEPYANLEDLTHQDVADYLVAKVVELSHQAKQSGITDDERAGLRAEMNLYNYVGGQIGDAVSRGEGSPDQILAALARRREWLMDDNNVGEFRGELANRGYRERLIYTLDAVEGELARMTPDRLREIVGHAYALDPRQGAAAFPNFGGQS